MAAGLPACRRGWHPAARKRVVARSEFLESPEGFRGGNALSAGLEARLHVARMANATVFKQALSNITFQTLAVTPGLLAAKQLALNNFVNQGLHSEMA